MHLLLRFSSLKVLPILHLGRSHPSPSLVFYLLLFLGFYSLYLIELVLSFSKSPSLLKSEFGCKRYHVFRKGSFLSVVESVQPAPRPTGSVSYRVFNRLLTESLLERNRFGPDSGLDC